MDATDAATPEAEPTPRRSRGPLFAALFGIGCIACCTLPAVAAVGVVAGAGNLIAGGPALATLLLATAALAVTAFAWRRRATRHGQPASSGEACDADRGLHA